MGSHPLPTRQKSFSHQPRRALPHHDYTIAWICALPIERAAAYAMLDEVHSEPPRHHNDNNSYTLGSIHHHGVVIACLPEAQYGTNNAAAVLTNLMRTFTRIRFGLMVGIGGGAPSKADIRLGDVVVGTRVMQYDLGKIVEHGEMYRTAAPKSPHQSLGTVVSTLRSQHELGHSRISSILQEKMDQHPMYHRPNLPDRLFFASYSHDPANVDCNKCDRTKLVPRCMRSFDDPKIHYGAIASANQVMKHGLTRDKLARQLDTLCFEMEAAGVMDVLPCLPIRGICDYSDSHKSKEWQRYAAATAAAYAREFLEVLAADGKPTQPKEYMPTDGELPSYQMILCIELI